MGHEFFVGVLFKEPFARGIDELYLGVGLVPGEHKDVHGDEGSFEDMVY